MYVIVYILSIRKFAMSAQTVKPAAPIQKIFKLSPEHVRKLKVASHRNFMSETELVRLLIEQVYEKTLERDNKSAPNV